MHDFTGNLLFTLAHDLFQVMDVYKKWWRKHMKLSSSATLHHTKRVSDIFSVAAKIHCNTVYLCSQQCLTRTLRKMEML